jgi:hypothetical protein
MKKKLFQSKAGFGESQYVNNTLEATKDKSNTPPTEISFCGKILPGIDKLKSVLLYTVKILVDE